MLELGMGFHPDFTGRQNAFMAGQLLGMGAEDIARLMPEIEGFAEISDYIDQPVRVYSSGMQVRLAFSVATAIRPDILIVDEALSVGDVLFQQKCMARIRQFREQGTTLLLVTHDTAALYAICDRAIVLGKGRCLYQGETKKAVEIYLEILGVEKSIEQSKPSHEAILEAAQALQSEPDKEGMNLFATLDRYVTAIDFIGSQGEVLQHLGEGEEFSIRFVLYGLKAFTDPHIGFRIQDRLGLVMFETNTYCQQFSLEEFLSDGVESLSLIVRCTNNLSQGEYSLAVGIEQEGYGQGAFKSVICPTKVVRSFAVVRRKESNLWGGVSNLYPEFFCSNSAMRPGFAIKG
jgi:lipopolysaccharide transport system ATP-binding protein